MKLEKRKIVYFGMTGMFSTVPLRRLLEAEFEIEAVILPRPEKDKRGMFLMPTFDAPDMDIALPMIKMPVVDNIHVEASRFGLSIFSIGDFGRSVWAALKGLDPDLFVFGCFPWKVPEEVLSIPKDGSINLHPSLLPKYRGPDPLFWQFLLDEPIKGVSIHFMNAALDQGDLIAQKEVRYDLEDSDFYDIEVQAANGCADLLLEQLSKKEIVGVEQRLEEGSYFGMPTEKELILPAGTSTAQLEFLNQALSKYGKFRIDH